MVFADMYVPHDWSDFFITVGSSAAVLCGLVFVAMAMNLPVVVRDAAHRYRSASTVTGFTAIFMICSLAQMDHLHHRELGFLWLAIAAIAGTTYVNGYRQTIRQKGSELAINRWRVFISIVYYAVQTVAAAVIVLGHVVGLYAGATAMVLYFPMLISSAWLLVIRGYQEDHKR